jgi:4-aminobutyrate aminotransferase-like enzyme
MVLGLAKIIDTIESKLKMIPDPKKILENAEKWGFGPRSIELLKRALEVESLGAMPFSMYDAPPIVEEAVEDAIIIDADGRRYIDMMAGFAVSNVGHHRKEVLAAIIEQFNKLVQYSEMLSEVRVKLA